MYAWLLCNAFLEYDELVFLFATCRTAAMSPMLAPQISKERNHEFCERIELAARDGDCPEYDSDAEFMHLQRTPDLKIIPVLVAEWMVDFNWREDWLRNERRLAEEEAQQAGWPDSD